MAIPDISSSSPRPTAFPARDKSVSSKGGDQMLGAEDFLKILTIQLTHQNPLDPMKDTEFISQMSQFNELEQSREMSQTIKAQTYLGKKVSVVDVSSGREHSVSGLVTAFERESDGDKIVINGNKYPASSIRRIELVEQAPLYAMPQVPSAPNAAPAKKDEDAGNPIAEAIGDVVKEVLKAKV